MISPSDVVDRHLHAYNARDIEAYCALFVPDALVCNLNGNGTMLRGIEAIRAHYTARFKCPDLHCAIKARIEVGSFVIDHEQVSGIADGPLEVVAIYDVRDSLVTTIRILWP